MATIGWIKVGLTTDTTGLAKGLQSGGSMLDAFVGKLSVVGAALAAAFAGQKVIGGIASMISSASDLSESVHKVEAIFGGSSSKIVSAANQMAEAFGMSKNEFLGAAAQLGSLFKGAGMAQGAAAGLSVEFTKLAADVASFNNLSFDEAFTKLRSGLTGESEPLKSLGIMMNDGAVKARAYALGIAKAGEELSELAKMQARMSLMKEGLADAAGDKEKNKDQYSELTKAFWGHIDNISAKLGEAFLPAMEKGLTLANQLLGSFEKWANTSGVIELLGTLIEDLIITPIQFLIGMVEALDEAFSAFGVKTVDVFMGILRAVAGTAHMIAGFIKTITFGYVDLGSVVDMASAKAEKAVKKPKVASVMPSVLPSHGSGPQFAGALEFGSADAYSAVLSSRAQQQNSIQDRALTSIDGKMTREIELLKIIAQAMEGKGALGTNLATSLATI